MTHEFKTPISTIAISSEVLKQPSIIETPDRLLNYATIIQTENNRLKQQVERVLQMAQLEKNDIHLKRERCDVHHLINEATKNINLSVDAKQAKINLQLQAQTQILLVDKLHVTNIIFNLVDNALKYSVQLPIILIKTYCRHCY
jgi:two-component system phosphate regulon sensor histidine kinase PhoR